MPTFTAIVIALAADPSLGRVDKSSLSQETLMELFIEKVTNKARVFTDINPSSTASWRKVSSQNVRKGFRGVVVNDTGEIQKIDFRNCNIQGSIQLEWMPSTITNCLLSMNRITGSVNLEDLPDKLEVLSMRQNRLTGTLNLENLPSQFAVLILSKNNFTGSVNLTKLPSTLQDLFLDQNQLSGSVDVTKLPDSLIELELSNNDFSGWADFSKLPDRLESLNVSYTKLEGEIVQRDSRGVYLRESNVKLVESG
mmetsp:Transcript_29557/g.45690  ORF Transcript_29557/g.45690 Transcript_29557/m.45690 type:complete len:253 (-) Transcript_29557:35-793(-)